MDNDAVVSGSSNASGVCTFTIKFTSGSGLSTTDLTAYPIVATRATAIGFVQAVGAANGQITFTVYSASGTAEAGRFSFVLYQP